MSESPPPAGKVAGARRAFRGASGADIASSRYYQPEPSANGRINDTETRAEQSPTSNQICSSDTALTAFCQLVTWRIGAQRAMLW
jgi:hypothetical protein